MFLSKKSRSFHFLRVNFLKVTFLLLTKKTVDVMYKLYYVCTIREKNMCSLSLSLSLFLTALNDNLKLLLISLFFISIQNR